MATQKREQVEPLLDHLARLDTLRCEFKAPSEYALVTESAETKIFENRGCYECTGYDTSCHAYKNEQRDWREEGVVSAIWRLVRR